MKERSILFSYFKAQLLSAPWECQPGDPKALVHSGSFKEIYNEGSKHMGPRGLVHSGSFKGACDN